MKIHYEIYGSGPELLIIPGYTVNTRFWDLVRPFLAGYKLILIDNRGSGQSEDPDIPYRLDDMAQDALTLIDELHLNKPHILGHSMGACIAQIIAHRAPEKIGKLILNNGCLKTPAYFNARCLSLVRWREMGIPEEISIEASIPWNFSNKFLSQTNIMANIVRTLKNTPNPQSLIGQKRQLEALLQFNSTPFYTQIRSPTLVLTSDEERVLPIADSHLLAAGIPGARLHTFQQMGHNPQIEAPLHFAQIITSFLAF